jgi:hypothetical protein
MIQTKLNPQIGAPYAAEVEFVDGEGQPFQPVADAEYVWRAEIRTTDGGTLVYALEEGDGIDMTGIAEARVVLRLTIDEVNALGRQGRTHAWSLRGWDADRGHAWQAAGGTLTVVPYATRTDVFPEAPAAPTVLRVVARPGVMGAETAGIFLTGYVGPPGEPGTGFTILGSFSDPAQLPADGNESGDGYIIDGDLYVWDGSAWNNVGKVQGPKGEPGPAGDPGDPGPEGDDGWVPVLAAVPDGARVVHQVVDWTGGTGAKPATGAYVSPTGHTANISEATDIRGPQGPAGDGEGSTVTVAAEDADTITLSI